MAGIINLCPHCQAPFEGASNFCTVCGTPKTPTQPQPLAGPNPHQVAARGFAQTFGLHPAMALLTVIVNTMVFGTGLITGGIGWALSIPVGIVLGIITYLAQKKWYGDDQESAFIKALILAFLTAIPTSLPGYLTIPAGVVGFFRRE
jgi:hypothetical protein